MKKVLVTMISIILAASVAVGCQSSEKSGSPKAVEAGNDVVEDMKVQDGPVKLTVLDGYAPEDPHGQYIYQYAEEFMEQNPDIKVEIQAVATNDIPTKLAAMAASPEELPTIFFCNAETIQTLNDLGLPRDLMEYMPEDMREGLANGVMDACTIDGKMVFYPIVVQPQAVIYRKDRFEEAGLQVPVSWDEFIQCAKALTKDTDQDGQTDQWGFSMVGSNNSSGQSRFMAYLWSNGFELVHQEDGSKEWKTDISTDPEFIKVFSRWTGMNEEGIVPTGITEVDYPTSSNYFAMGYTSMFLTGSNALGVAYSNNPELKGKLSSFKVPGDYPGTALGAEGYAISSYASEAETKAAVEYLKFFIEHDKDMKFWEISGKIPATKEGQKVAYIAGEDYTGYLSQIKDGCRPVLAFPGMSGLKSALGKSYSSVFSGEKTNEEAVEALVSDVEELLEDYN